MRVKKSSKAKLVFCLILLSRDITGAEKTEQPSQLGQEEIFSLDEFGTDTILTLAIIALVTVIALLSFYVYFGFRDALGNINDERTSEDTDDFLVEVQERRDKEFMETFPVLIGIVITCIVIRETIFICTEKFPVIGKIPQKQSLRAYGISVLIHCTPVTIFLSYKLFPSFLAGCQLVRRLLEVTGIMVSRLTKEAFRRFSSMVRKEDFYKGLTVGYLLLSLLLASSIALSYEAFKTVFFTREPFYIKIKHLMFLNLIFLSSHVGTELINKNYCFSCDTVTKVEVTPRLQTPQFMCISMYVLVVLTNLLISKVFRRNFFGSLVVILFANISVFIATTISKSYIEQVVHRTQSLNEVKIPVFTKLKVIMTNLMHPSLPLASILLWLVVVLGVFIAVGAFGCVFLILIEPCIKRRRSARAARVAARFNRDDDTAVLLSRCIDGNM